MLYQCADTATIGRLLKFIIIKYIFIFINRSRFVFFGPRGRLFRQMGFLGGKIEPFLLFTKSRCSGCVGLRDSCQFRMSERVVPRFVNGDKGGITWKILK